MCQYLKTHPYSLYNTVHTLVVASLTPAADDIKNAAETIYTLQTVTTPHKAAEKAHSMQSVTIVHKADHINFWLVSQV